MKINSIKISNILSFEHKEKIDECQEIKFVDGLNVLIGPNGAGKSNFLEIINQLFNKSLFQPVTFTDAHLISFHKTGVKINLNKTLDVNRGQIDLPKNNRSSSDIKEIKIVIGLNEIDRNNLVFILKNREKINEFFKKYCRRYPSFPSIVEDEIAHVKSITLLFKEEGNTRQLANVTNFMKETDQFISFYLEYFNLLQYLIMIANNEESQDWSPLKNTFAIMSSYRNFNELSSSFTIQQNENESLSSIKANLANEKLLHVESKEPLVFPYFKHKICYAFHKMLTTKGIPSDHDPIDDFSDDVFLSVNKVLNETLDIKLYLKRSDVNTLEYELNFIDIETNNALKIQELSAGEKGIIYFILSIYGYDLKNGVMIIDEPEIHIHPQMQELCLDLLEKVVKDLDMQFIVATHSPIFVNSRTIDGVQRFYKDDNGSTKTIVSKKSPEEKNLVRYLDFTRATKILFANKVVMVEGDSDEYFYRFYFEKYRETKPEIRKLDFIYIGGKDYYKEWKKFFDDWKLMTFFIRDLDDFGGGESGIKEKYKENVFILKKGKLENYLGEEKSDKLGNVVDFCKNRYENWKKESSNTEKITELNQIFGMITPLT